MKIFVQANYIYANNLVIASIKIKKEDPEFSKTLAEKAVFYYLQTIRLYPYHPEFHTKLATVYLKNLNDPENAEICFRNALYIDSTNFISNYELGRIRFEKKEFQKSLSYFKKAYTLKPDDSLTLFYYAQSACNAGDLNTCYQVNKKFTELYPDLLYPYVNLGIYYSKRSQDDTAILYLQKAVDLGYRNPVLLKEMAKYYNKHLEKEKENLIQNLLLNNP